MVQHLQTIRIKLRSLENSKQFQDAIGLIREQMKNNLQWNVLRSFGIICAILSLILLRFAAIPLILLVVGLYYWPQYKKRKALFGDRIRSNDEIYLDDILSPVLKEVFPQASIKEDGSIPSEALSRIYVLGRLIFYVSNSYHFMMTKS